MSVGFLRLGLVLCAFVLVFSRCATVKPSVSPLVKAEAMFVEGNYAEALPLYRQFIIKADENNQAVDASVLKNAAVAASHQNEYELTFDFVERLGNLNLLDAETARLFVESSAPVDDDVRKLSFMTKHRSLLFEVMGQEAYYTALCSLSGRVGDLQGVVDSWTMAGKAAKLEWFPLYYEGVKDIQSPDALMALCDEVLTLQADHQDALKYKAVLLYEKSEARYKELMDDYNKNKNATSYAYLKRDLKRLSADYRMCRDLFEKLRLLAPDNGNYIRYLYNVYLRLDLNDQAKKLEKLL